MEPGALRPIGTRESLRTQRVRPTRKEQDRHGSPRRFDEELEGAGDGEPEERPGPAEATPRERRVAPPEDGEAGTRLDVVG